MLARELLDAVTMYLEYSYKSEVFMLLYLCYLLYSPEYSEYSECIYTKNIFLLPVPVLHTQNLSHELVCPSPALTNAYSSRVLRVPEEVR
jgi:hypothetical protein